MGVLRSSSKRIGGRARLAFGAAAAALLGAVVLAGCGGGSGGGKLATDVTPSDCGTVSRDINQTVYPAGTNVTLTAEAMPGCRFKEWQGAATGSTRTISVATVGNMKVTAVFEKFDDLTMIPVKGGTFTMGCTPEQGDECDGDEKSVRSVTVGDFSIGKYEVTQRLWKQIMGNSPSNFKGDDLPVETVSWNDVQNFIEELNERTGKKYRLPTEAEWEYAARGGNKSKKYKYSGSSDIKEVAWYYENSGDAVLDEKNWDVDKLKSNKNRTHPVGTKSANELGIYDMSGNVWEWVSDWYGDYTSGAQTNPTGPSSGSRRVIRGGSWSGVAGNCRVSIRNYGYPGYRFDFLGFRLVLSSPP
jgi:formylglycine-generating enzyme required for sulfatase activity